VKTNSSSADPGRPEPDFREFLCEELGRRCRDNPQYSLRAFAGRLGVDHSTLGQILRGRRAVTEQTIRRFATTLEVPEAERDRYLAVHGATGRGTATQQQFRRLSADVVAAVADWHHYAILELLKLRNFQPDSRWIARVLDIAVDDVNAALARLTRLEMLRMESRERWVDLTGHAVATFTEFTEEALRCLGRELHSRAVDALDRRSAGRTIRLSTTVAVDAKRLPALRARIAAFHRELLEQVDDDPGRDDVFQLELHLFPLTDSDSTTTGPETDR